MTEFSSSGYWEARYRQGGNSGTGSYGRLADYKAAFINSFISLNQVRHVIEFGCGDGNQLESLDVPQYIGVDVSNTILHRCRSKFPDNKYQFVDYAGLIDVKMVDLGLSMDVIFHLIEDDVFESYMRNLFCFSERFVIVYSSDYDAEWPAKHVRHRSVSGYVKRRHPEWKLLAHVPNVYPYDPHRSDTSFSDFLVFGKDRHECRIFIPSAEI